jgi:hypothetical protein
MMEICTIFLEGWCRSVQSFGSHQVGRFFVTRAPSCSMFGRLVSRPVDCGAGLIFGQSVELTAFYPH